MCRVVEVKIGRRIVKFVNRQTQLFEVDENMQRELDNKFANDMKKALAKEKKRINFQESLKSRNTQYPIPPKLKADIKLAYSKVLDEQDEKANKYCNSTESKNKRHPDKT